MNSHNGPTARSAMTKARAAKPRAGKSSMGRSSTGKSSAGKPSAPGCQETRSQAAQTAQAIINLIVAGRYPLHSQLPPERRLCESLGVSRAVLRDALDMLEAESRIWRHVGKGTFVGGRPTSVHSNAEELAAHTTLEELLESRMLMEPAIARLAALRAQSCDIQLMEEYHQGAARADSWFAWDRWDMLFHRSIAEASGNSVMISFMDNLVRTKKESRWSIVNAPTFDCRLRDSYVAHHADLIAAIIRHDLDRAERAMRNHVSVISRSIGPALNAAWVP